ncbi:unnamed protein product [Brugia pahangi]|uniref:Calpain catalytic domain-containing protein n=1 Tax=Brugia pahangi TaxID=6280 RepID=A0A0N4TP39_BRUPA|nr:unnamed protein product [Brugia pahangi]
MIARQSLGNMWIIVSNTKGEPPTCGCKHGDKPPPPRVMVDEWIDLWPDKKLNKALNKNLNTHQGENPEQYVALWYQQGEPVMQLILVGIKTHSLQIFIELPDFVRGYDYDWKLFSLCALFGEKEWFSVHVDRKDIISPCADIRNKKASAAFGGKEHIMGPSVQKQMVLCPKDLATNLINCKRPPLNEWSFVTNL